MGNMPMTSTPPRRQVTSGRGCTVVDLLMVLSVSTIVATVAAPNVDQAMKTYRDDLAIR